MLLSFHSKLLNALFNETIKELVRETGQQGKGILKFKKKKKSKNFKNFKNWIKIKSKILSGVFDDVDGRHQNISYDDAVHNQKHLTYESPSFDLVSGSVNIGTEYQAHAGSHCVFVVFDVIRCLSNGIGEQTISFDVFPGLSCTRQCLTFF